MTSGSNDVTPRLRVLIAEDEALIRMDLAELLEEEGYEVVGQAPDGQVAIDLARSLHPDLVVLDIKMPRVDGLAAARVIAGERIAPVVMLTAFSQRELIDRAADAGAVSYVVKPFGPADLVPAIELARARFEQMRLLAEEVEDLSDRLETRKLVERAKSAIQEGLGLTEVESFRWLQKTAMDLRLPMRQVAEAVVTKGINPS